MAMGVKMIKKNLLDTLLTSSFLTEILDSINSVMSQTA